MFELFPARNLRNINYHFLLANSTDSLRYLVSWFKMHLWIFDSLTNRSTNSNDAAASSVAAASLIRLYAPLYDRALRAYLRTSVPFRVMVHTITLSVHLNDPFWLQTQTGTRIQRAVLPTSAQ